MLTKQQKKEENEMEEAKPNRNRSRQGLILKQSLGPGQPNKIYVKIQAENSPTGQAEKRLTGGAFFDPKAGRKMPPNNNKSNKYVRNYEPKEGVSL